MIELPKEFFVIWKGALLELLMKLFVGMLYKIAHHLAYHTASLSEEVMAPANIVRVAETSENLACSRPFP